MLTVYLSSEYGPELPLAVKLPKARSEWGRIIPGMTSMSNEQERARVREVREGFFHQDVRKLASDVKALLEYVRHIDIKLDILQSDVDEMAASLRLSDRLADVESAIERERVFAENLTK